MKPSQEMNAYPESFPVPGDSRGFPPTTNSNTPLSSSLSRDCSGGETQETGSRLRERPVDPQCVLPRPPVCPPSSRSRGSKSTGQPSPSRCQEVLSTHHRTTPAPRTLHRLRSLAERSRQTKHEVVVLRLSSNLGENLQPDSDRSSLTAHGQWCTLGRRFRSP